MLILGGGWASTRGDWPVIFHHEPNRRRLIGAKEEKQEVEGLSKLDIEKARSDGVETRSRDQDRSKIRPREES